MKTIKELKEERAALAARMSQMLDVAEEREAKGFTAEERAKYDGLKKEYETLDERIALREEDEARAAASARRIGGDAGKTAEGRAARRGFKINFFLAFPGDNKGVVAGAFQRHAEVTAAV